VAIWIRGKSKCPLCGLVLDPDADVQMFPSGLFSPDEPAWEVNDAAVHRACLASRPYGPDALTRVQKYVSRMRGES